MELRERVAGLTRPPAAPTTVQGELYRGYGDGLARAFELAVTPALFCGLGYLLDRWLGILPVFSILLFLVAVVGMFAKTWYTYEARMREEDAAAPWARRCV